VRRRAHALIYFPLLLKIAWTSPPLSAQTLYAKASADLEQKDYAKAEQEFSAVEAQTPGATNALALRAKALIHLDRFEEAQRSLERYLQANARSADARYLLAFVLFRRNLPRESLAMYTEAARLKNPSGGDLKIVGLDYVLLDDFPDAARWLERAVAESPNDAEAVYYLGRAYYVRNSFDQAIAAFRRALELDPRFAKAENNLGLAYAAKNRPDLAEAAYRKAIELSAQGEKKSAEPYLNLAGLLSRAGQEAESLRLLDTAQQIAGKSDRIAELRGQILLSQNRLPEAEAQFRAAIAFEPRKASLHFLLGRALKREGKSEEAEREFAQTKALLGTRSSAPN